jgi:hypothetical protein
MNHDFSAAKALSRKTLFYSSICLILIVFINQNTSLVNAAPPVFQDAFPLQQFDCRYYVCHLGAAESITIDVECAFKGEFDVFIFSFRPITTFVSPSGYDPQIITLSAAHNTSLGKYTHLEYTSPADDIIYIQVVLIDNGTDTYYLNATKALELYFIPFIPGFSPLFLGVSVFITIVVLYKVHSKKIVIK